MSGCEKYGSGAELAEVVIEVLVHAAAPLLRSERSEEGMGMAGAVPFPAVMKLTNLLAELFLFAGKVALTGDNQAFVSGAIARKGPFVGEEGLDERTEEPAQKNSWGIEAATGHVHCRGTMGHHLRYVHLAPLPLSGGL